MSDYEKRVGACIRHWREQRKLSQVALAKAVGVDKMTIWRIENAKTPLSLPVVREIARSLSVDPSILMGEEPVSTEPTDSELALGLIKKILAMDHAELWVNARRLGVIAIGERKTSDSSSSDVVPKMETVRPRGR
jgi:transcriptional regulator with XRE-family HTH domain